MSFAQICFLPVFGVSIWMCQKWSSRGIPERIMHVSSPLIIQPGRPLTMVRGTFLFWWHIFLLRYALWSRIRQICRLRIYLCLLNLSRVRAFWKTCWPCVKRTLLSKVTTKSDFCSMSPKNETFLGKTHFVTLVSIGPRTKNQHSAVAISQTWFMWISLMTMLVQQRQHVFLK